MKLLSKLLFISAATITLASCAVNETQTVVDQTQQAAQIQIRQNYNIQPIKVVIVNFENASGYNNGVFNSNNTVSREGYEALQSAMIQSGYYTVLNRNVEEFRNYENSLKLDGSSYQTLGADYLVSASILEYGRKTVGDQQLFGVIGKSKKQVAYAKVVINLIDTKTSAAVASATGAGEISIDQRQVLGTGSYASYDSAQNSKTLGIAIRDAVNKLSEQVERRVR